MTFAEDMQNDLDGFFNPDEFARTAVYTPTPGDPVVTQPVECAVIIDHDVVVPGGYNAAVVEFGTVMSALYSVVARPMKGSTFVIAGTTYTVQRLLEVDDDKSLVKVVVKEG